MKYEEAAERAQKSADTTGFDHGIERVGDGMYTAFMLPQKQNRYGRELRCEVRMCSDIDRCRPGHGPEAVR